MSKTLTIELSDSLEQQLAVVPQTVDSPLEQILLRSLQVWLSSMQSLQHQSPAIWREAAQILGFIGTELAVPSLAQAAINEEQSVRQAAIAALQKIGTESALAVLADRPHETMANTEPDLLKSLIGTL